VLKLKELQGLLRELGEKMPGHAVQILLKNPPANRAVITVYKKVAEAFFCAFYGQTV